MAMAASISLVDEAYDLGAVPDSRRQMLLQEIIIAQADLDIIERWLIAADFHFHGPLHRLFQGVRDCIWSFRNAVDEVEDAIDYHRMVKVVGNPISKFVNNLARFDTWSSLKD